MNSKKYCLDANVLIEAWQKYYCPDVCPDYWTILAELGRQDIIFIPEMVSNEILRTEDDLAEWLKSSGIPIRKIDEQTASCLKDIFAANPIHKRLVDSVKGRSLADPWVIAHAICERATVVTKEEKITALISTKIKIPNVCENMGVKWINDFDFIRELNIQFSCKLNYTMPHGQIALF
ncbi:MAG: DUF4411 family protein [Bacteroidales bacterium]|nr:DUF4411 family protein [Bacteroidales bacterium]MEA4840598.1 DUF4411 family protein [Bacteroidales bacterium]